MLKHRRQAYPKAVEHACLTNAVNAHDQIEPRLKPELSRRDGAKIREFQSSHSHNVFPMSICPVTAAAMRAARRSLMRMMVLSAAERRASSLAVSEARDETISACS